MPLPQAPHHSLSVQLGQAPGPLTCWDLGMPVLRGEQTETLFPTTSLLSPEPAGPFTLYTSGDFLLGIAQGSISEGLCAATQALYEELLDLIGSYTLCRVWNYVPAINACDASGLENYRAFCRGRAQAFDSTHGDNFEPRLCAASAVGTDSALLTIAFAAHKTPSLAHENPLQIPAYAYPNCYGPRPPSFARASVVPLENGVRHVFISGTAAIRGHETIGIGDTRAQLLCTLENLQAIGNRCGLGAKLGANTRFPRWFKIYLRHTEDLELVARILDEHLLLPSDHVSYLRSDICRADLLVEIEMTALSITGP